MNIDDWIEDNFTIRFRRMQAYDLERSMSYAYGIDKRKYFGHSAECMCDDCLNWYWNHKLYCDPAPCICEGCARTRLRAGIIKGTQETERPNIKEDIVANISICDRPECGSMSKSNVAGALELFTGGDNGEGIRGQLCPACAGELVAWFEGPVTGERQKAYSKAWERPNEKTLEKLTSAQLMTLALERGREELNAE